MNEIVGIFKRLWHGDELRKYADQFHYGNREVILRSLGLADNVYFKGRLQHGFIPNLTWENYFKSIKNSLPISRTPPFFAWNEAIAESCQRWGGMSYAIGSPWAHLLKKVPNLEKPPRNELEDVTALFPNHSYAGHSIDNLLDHTYINPFRGKKLVTCLYWSDFVNPKIKNYYESFSDFVVCCGYRGSSGIEIPWDDLGGRIDFLPNLYGILEKVGRVLVEEVSSMFWYGASLGKELVVLSDSSHYRVRDNDGERIDTYSSYDIAKQSGLENFSINKVLNQDREIFEQSLKILGFDKIDNARSALTQYSATDPRLSL